MAKSNAPTMEEFVLEGKIYWANLWKLDQYKKYSFSLTNLDEKNVDIAERANLKVKTDKPDWGSYVSLQRKELNAKNEPNGEIIVTDKDKRSWDKSKGIGNGSVVKTKGVSIEYEEGKWTNKTERVKVLELVEYNLSADSDEWDVIDAPVAEAEDEFGDALPEEMQQTSCDEDSSGETSEKDFD